MNFVWVLWASFTFWGVAAVVEGAKAGNVKTLVIGLCAVLLGFVIAVIGFPR